MQKLSLDPLTLIEDPFLLRDSVQLQLQKIQDYVNLLQMAANPVGAIIQRESATAPAGYLLCDGSSFSATAYPDLAAYLGGTTLPNYKGRVLVGQDTGQTEFDVLGETGGSKTSTAPHDHGLNNHSHGGTSLGDSPNHGHTVNSHNHGGGTGIHAHVTGGQVSTGGAHTHGGAANQFAGEPVGGGFFSGNGITSSSVGVANTFEAPGTTGVSVNHGHGINGDNGVTAGSSASAASGNLQPYRVVNFFIKT